MIGPNDFSRNRVGDEERQRDSLEGSLQKSAAGDQLRIRLSKALHSEKGKAAVAANGTQYAVHGRVDTCHHHGERHRVGNGGVGSEIASAKDERRADPDGDTHSSGDGRGYVHEDREQQDHGQGKVVRRRHHDS